MGSRAVGFIWLMAVSGAIASGCPDGEQSCKGVECSGFGECVKTAGKIGCECIPGFMADGTSCVAEPGCREMGLECVASSSCCDGVCLRFNQEQVGYCSMESCDVLPGCENHSDDGHEMCCVDLGGDNYYCIKFGPEVGCPSSESCGLACDRDSQCGYIGDGDVCLGAGTELAFCSHECSRDSDCADCREPGDPDAPYGCVPVNGGQTFCMPFHVSPCIDSQMCEAGETCFPNPTSDGLGITGACGNLGDLPVGAVCDEEADPNSLPPEERCSGFYCMDDHCTGVCSGDDTCPEGMVCEAMGFCMDDGCEIIASIPMCQWRSCPCTSCVSDAVCGADEFCDYYVGLEEQLVKICQAEECDPGVDAECSVTGGPCGDGVHSCRGGICDHSVSPASCTELCEDDWQCPAGFVCGEMSVTGDITLEVCVME